MVMCTVSRVGIPSICRRRKLLGEQSEFRVLNANSDWVYKLTKPIENTSDRARTPCRDIKTKTFGIQFFFSYSINNFIDTINSVI